jgi:hypothetical protein
MENSTEMIAPEPKSETAKKADAAIEATNHRKSTEAGAEWLLQMLEKKPSYSERIPLKRDQSFDVIGDATEFPLSTAQLIRSAHDMELTQKGLYDLTEEISHLNPNLQFSFKRDPGGKWIEYSVEKKNLKVGDEAIWESGGQLQFKKPRKIVAFQASPDNKTQLVIFEGDPTGVPLEEVLRAKE